MHWARKFVCFIFLTKKSSKRNNELIKKEDFEPTFLIEILATLSIEFRFSAWNTCRKPGPFHTSHKTANKSNKKMDISHRQNIMSTRILRTNCTVTLWLYLEWISGGKLAKMRHFTSEVTDKHDAFFFVHTTTLNQKMFFKYMQLFTLGWLYCWNLS